MMRGSWMLVPCGVFAVLVACGRQPDAPPTSPPGEVVAVGEVMQEPDDLSPGIVTQVKALRQVSARAAAQCQASNWGGWTADQAAEAWPADGADLAAACGEVRGLYDAHVQALGGTSRAADVLLSHLARMAEDLAYVERTLRPSERASERANAANHLRDALADLQRYLDSATDEPVRSYRVRMGFGDVWARMVRQDDVGAGGLDGAFARLAFNQGFDVAYVRHRMLATMLRIAHAEWAERVAALSRLEDLEPGERQTRTAYLAVVGEVVAAHEGALAAYLAGQVTDAAARAPLQARCAQAHAAWQVAWKAELARVAP